MQAIRSHLSRCVVAGIVALLPIGGTVLSALHLESMIADSWLKDDALKTLVSVGTLPVEQAALGG